MFALVGCYNNNTGETNIGDSIRFKLPAFPETGSNKVQVFTEMHYQPSYRSQEGPRLDVPDSAVPISGKEVVLTSIEEYAALQSPGGDTANGAGLFAINCVVCHGTELDGQGSVMVTGPSMVPANLRGEVTMERTDGELYGLISYGGNTGFTTRVPALDRSHRGRRTLCGSGFLPYAGVPQAAHRVGAVGLGDIPEGYAGAVGGAGRFVCIVSQSSYPH